MRRMAHNCRERSMDAEHCSCHRGAVPDCLTQLFQAGRKREIELLNLTA